MENEKLIIGRHAEQQELHRLYNSKNAEFVAVYGRRRVGKTFLIRETFYKRLTFCHTGLNIYDENDHVTTGDQLRHFYHTLQQHGADVDHTPEDWLEAFYMLESLLEKLDDGSRQVVFIDELPWLDTDGSRFMMALEAFWNTWGAARHNLMLIVCGSAASWMIKNLVKNKGGLFDRLTFEMKLKPFTLSECEQLLESKNIHYSRYDTTVAYMALGGIPYYFSYFRQGLSLAQNLDALLTEKNAKLGMEFRKLFRSLFKNPANYVEIIRYLSTRHLGFTREDIASHLGITTGGTLSNILDTLAASDFIEYYKPFDAKKYEKLYRLTDPFCRTWIHFMENKQICDPQFWQHNITSPAIYAWGGTAFEEVCMLHTAQIRRALGLAVVMTETSAFTLRADEHHDGTQCDMIIRRADRVVNLCEMKFCMQQYIINKEEDLKLRNRLGVVREYIRKTENLQLTFISTYGVKENLYSSIVQSQVTLDDLFKD